MIREIMSEVKYLFWMVVILSIGMLSCIAHNHYYTWEANYLYWEYSSNPQEGAGWIDSIIRRDNENK